MVHSLVTSFKSMQARRLANIIWEIVPCMRTSKHGKTDDCLKHSTLGFGTVRFPARSLRVEIPWQSLIQLNLVDIYSAIQKATPISPMLTYSCLLSNTGTLKCRKNLKILTCVKEWLCMSLYCLKQTQPKCHQVEYFWNVTCGKSCAICLSLRENEDFSISMLFNMVALGCVSNSTNSCTTIL